MNKFFLRFGTSMSCVYFLLDFYLCRALSKHSTCYSAVLFSSHRRTSPRDYSQLLCSGSKCQLPENGPQGAIVFSENRRTG
ncbi:hypothetical protein RRG08_021179, partial [Elysia crispata]